LGILSEVEDKSRRKTNDLPSWVPDLAVQSKHFPLDRLKAMDATGVRDGHISVPRIHGKQLTLEGMEVGPICSVFKWENNDGFCVAVFQLALEMAAIYSPSGESRLEAIWRTALADHVSFDSRDYHPSPDRCKAFCHVVKYGLRSLKNDLATTESNEALSIFQKMEGETVSTLNETMRWKLRGNDVECYGDQSPLSESASEMEHDFDSILDFFGQSMLVRDRCLFRTSSGYIGMALNSIKASDTVWLLNGGRVPYILRKRPSDGRYEFFGDCYLHGVMLGELMKEDLRNRFMTVHIA
jgi:hypothetical protein